MNLFLWLILALVVLSIPFVLRRPAYALYGAFALSGVLMSPDLPVVGDQLALVDILLLLAIGLLLALALVSERRRFFLSNGYVRLAVSFAILFWVLSLFSAASGMARYGASVSGSLVNIANYLYGVFIMVCVVHLVDDWKRWQGCLAAWAVGVALIGVFSTTAFLGLGPDWALTAYGHRVTSAFRRVNQLHSYVAPAMAVLFGWFFSPVSKPWWRVFSVVVFALAAIALLATGARTAFILLVLALAGIAVYAGVAVRRSPVISGITLAIVVLGAVALGSLTVMVLRDGRGALPSSMRPAARPIERLARDGDLDAMLGPRADQIGIVAENWLNHAVLGVGPGNFASYFDNRHEVHNSFLGVLIEHGVPGLVSLLAFIVFVFLAGIRSGGRSVPPAGTVMIAMAVFAFALVVVYGATTFGLRQRIFWLVAGLLLSAGEISSRRPAESPPL